MNKKGQEGTIILLLLFVFAILLGMLLINPLYKGYVFNKEMGSYCELSYEASDIDKKISYLDKCIRLIEKEDLEANNGYVAWFFKKPSNEMNEINEVMLSLQTRMHNLKDMEKDSFEYQKGLEQVEEETEYFVQNGLMQIKTAYCYDNTWTIFLC